MRIAQLICGHTKNLEEKTGKPHCMVLEEQLTRLRVAAAEVLFWVQVHEKDGDGRLALERLRGASR